MIQKRGNIVALAESMTSVAFASIPRNSSHSSPLHRLARSLGVAVRWQQPELRWHSKGMLWDRLQLQPTLLGDVEAQVNIAGWPGRFVLAHELAHRIADLFLTAQQRESIRADDWEGLMDECAGRLVLPDHLLLAACPDGEPLEMTPAWINSVHHRLRVSMVCLLKRLNDLACKGALTLANCAFITAPAVSRKRRTHYDLRVITRCMPLGWFLPSNKRLSSLGLESLCAVFWRAEPFAENIAEDNVVISRRIDGQWKRVPVRAPFRYVIYTASARTQRSMLATFSCTGLRPESGPGKLGVLA